MCEMQHFHLGEGNSVCCPAYSVPLAKNQPASDPIAAVHKKYLQQYLAQQDYELRPTAIDHVLTPSSSVQHTTHVKSDAPRCRIATRLGSVCLFSLGTCRLDLSGCPRVQGHGYLWGRAPITVRPQCFANVKRSLKLAITLVVVCWHC
jgi:hypothetical protein